MALAHSHPCFTDHLNPAACQILCRGDFPQLFVNPTVQVINPRAFDASLMVIDNPMYQFVLPVSSLKGW